MCGIVGLFNFPVEENLIITMTKKLSLRGPDDYGIFIDPDAKIQLGQTRLSIIDLSNKGHQPMHYLNGKYTIVFNGEIYNFLTIKFELENLGYKFNTESDTEVILAAYDYWNQDCLLKFNGMFAFAIWDNFKKEMFIARDRFGIKPLIYFFNSCGFMFSSEIKAILESNLIPKKINKHAMFDFFSYGSVCQPNTIIENVKALLPGHFIKVNFSNQIEIIKYYDLKENVDLVRKKINKIEYPNLVNIVRSKIEESVKLTLVSDVEVGSFLSSGIDSIAISALTSSYLDSPLKTFTVGYEEIGNLKCEFDGARKASNFFRSIHKEILIKPEDFKKSFKKIVYSLDQPSCDGVNTYFVSEAASKNVKIAISGLGGDELFAGYPHFQYLLESTKRNANLFDRILVKFGKIRSNKFSIISNYRCNETLNNLSKFRNILSSKQIRKSFSTEFLKDYDPMAINLYLKQFIYEDSDIIENISYSEINNYLLNTLLRDSDVMSMANGIELRPVFLNHELVELALAIPSSYKIKNGFSKVILKDSLSNLVPPEILNFKKRGFEIPIYEWMYKFFKIEILKSLESEEIKQMFNDKYIENLRNDVHLEKNNRLIWAIFIFYNWMLQNKCEF
jgi:asparagine synthase (glutamine-hydrolysing)